MSKALIDVKGFKELSEKIKVLPDKLKRKELLKIYGQVATPSVKAARSFAPLGTKKHSRDKFGPGNLRKSIGKRVGRKGTERTNAVLYVGAKLKGKNKGWYAHFIEGGTTTGITSNPFMDKAFQSTKGLVTKEMEIKVAKYIQKQINRLSNV